MLDRNEKRDVLLNNHKLYTKMLEDKGVSSIRHYSKMKLSKVTATDMANLNILDHIFVTGDSLSKLSYKYYGDSRFWWIIATFNQKPIDNMIKLGETIHIPTPIEEIHYLLTRDD